MNLSLTKTLQVSSTFLPSNLYPPPYSFSNLSPNKVTKEVLQKIKDKKFLNRDQLIDTLSDFFENNLFPVNEQQDIVFELIEILKEEDTDSVIESIFNLLGIAFYSNICIDSIVEVSITLLDRLAPGSLVHALSIIGDSNLQNKGELIERYLASENPSVKDAAAEAIVLYRRLG